jgi:hypothetical protein
MDYQRTDNFLKYPHWPAHQTITVGYMNIALHLQVSLWIHVSVMIKQCYYNDFAIIVVIRALSSGMWCCVIWEKLLMFWKNILTPSPQAKSPACCLLVWLLGSFFASLPLKTETVCSSRTSLHFFQSMWCHIPVGSTLPSHYLGPPNLTIIAELLEEGIMKQKISSRYTGFTKMV